MTRQPRVLIVGGGPVGTVAALDAVGRGFHVALLERSAHTDHSPRASTFHPSTLEMIDRLGIMSDFMSVGLVARYVDFWDKPTRKLVARFDHDVLRNDTEFPFVVQTEQHKLVHIGLERLSGIETCAVHRQVRATGVRSTADEATVIADTPEGTREFTADFVIACDGGRSEIRKALGIEFPGLTWPERFIVLTTLTAFDEALGCSLRSYFADPEEWTNLFKVAGDDGAGRWRAVFPARIGEADDEALGQQAIERRLNRIHAGAAEQLVHSNLYTVHQRVASTFRRDRFFLAGDAAHVNNPIGGLGLNCGIHDVVELMDHLEEVALRGGDWALLDRYERRRRPLILEFVEQQTIDNKKRLEEQSVEQRLARQDELSRMASSETTQREFLLRSSLLKSVEQAKAIA